MGIGHGSFSSQSSGFRSAPSFGARPNFGGRVGSGFHSNFNSSLNPNFRGRFGTSFSTGFRRPFVGPRRFVHPRFYSSSSPFYFGYYGYPTLYSDYGYSTVDAYPAYDYYASNAAQSSNDLAQQQQDIDRLEDEVARLREERESAPAAPSKPPMEDQINPHIAGVPRPAHTGSAELCRGWRHTLDLQRAAGYQAAAFMVGHRGDYQSERRTRRGFPFAELDRCGADTPVRLLTWIFRTRSKIGVALGRPFPNCRGQKLQRRRTRVSAPHRFGRTPCTSGTLAHTFFSVVDNSPEPRRRFPIRMTPT